MRALAPSSHITSACDCVVDGSQCGRLSHHIIRIVFPGGFFLGFFLFLVWWGGGGGGGVREVGFVCVCVCWGGRGGSVDAQALDGCKAFISRAF